MIFIIVSNALIFRIVKFKAFFNFQLDTFSKVDFFLTKKTNPRKFMQRNLDREVYPKCFIIMGLYFLIIEKSKLHDNFKNKF